MLEELIERERQGDIPVGEAEDGTTMLLKNGPYGPYLQLGPDDQEGKPKRVSVPPGVSPNAVDASMAQRLLDLPRQIGAHPETGKRIDAGIGRYGPYVRHERTYASLTPEDDVLEIGVDRAVELLAAKKRKGRREPLRTLGEHPETGEPIELHDGRFGPYVKHGKTNASLRKEHSPDDLAMEQALELLAAREARKGAAKTSRKGASKSKAKATTKTKRAKTKRATAKKKASSTPKPKATPADLEPFLSELDDADREAVARVEGMAGHQAAPIGQVATALETDEADIAARHKRGLFKLRMTYGRARKRAQT